MSLARSSLAAVVALACVLALQATPALGATVTLEPEADAWVSQADPGANHGTDTTLEVDGAPVTRSYLLFSGSIPSGAIVTRTTLRLHFTTPSTSGLSIELTQNNNWTETGITFDNSAGLGTTGPVATTQRVETGWNNISVPLFRPNNPFTYFVTRTSGEGVLAASREGPASTRPQLLVEYAFPETTPTSLCSAGACVVSDPGVTSMSWDVTVADFNNDDLDDYLISRHESVEDQIQLQQADGTFAPYLLPIPAPPGSPSVAPGHFPFEDRHGCTAGDVNGDRLTDIYCMIGAAGGTGTKSNELWIQREDGTYLPNQASVWGVSEPNGRGRRPLLFDFTKDGLPDLYTTNFGPRADGLRSENVFYVNRGDHFEERMVDATGHLGFECVDEGNWDGAAGAPATFLDFLVCGSDQPQQPPPELQLFHNSGPTGMTEPRNFLLGPALASPRDATLEDVNGDGWEDLAVITQTQLQVRLNQRCPVCNRFDHVDFSAPLTDGKSLAVGDLTNDGRPDIYVVEGTETGPEGPSNAPDKLFVGPAWGQLPLPQTEIGTGDESEFITIAGSRTLIVTNGRDYSRGPVQFISFRAIPVIPPPPPKPPDTASQTPVGTTKLAKLPRAADVVKLPSSRRCVGRRGLRIRIRPAGAVKLVSADVFVNRKRVKAVKQSRLTDPISLRKLPKRKFTLKVVVTTADGRKLSRSGKYRRCAKQKRR